MTAPSHDRTGQKGNDLENAGTRGGAERIPVGVVGTGGMGGMHARCLHRKVAGARVAAVSDVDAGRAGKVAGECGGAAAFSGAAGQAGEPGAGAPRGATPAPR